LYLLIAVVEGAESKLINLDKCAFFFAHNCEPCSRFEWSFSKYGLFKVYTIMRKTYFAALLALSLSAFAGSTFANCVGYSGPGGPCSTGPGGGLSTGPGGGLSTGPGGGLSTGPGGGLSTGPGGGMSTGPGGGKSTGPGGGMSTGPGGGMSTGPGGGLSTGPGGGMSNTPNNWRRVPNQN